MAGGLGVLAAAWTRVTQGPLAAPAVMKHWPPLVPQKQFVESPIETQVAALAEKQFTTAVHSAMSPADARPQQPSVPAPPSEQFPMVQVWQSVLLVIGGSIKQGSPPTGRIGRLTEATL